MDEQRHQQSNSIPWYDHDCLYNAASPIPLPYAKSAVGKMQSGTIFTAHRVLKISQAHDAQLN
ncbi:MAG TPA: hypothetical protein VKB53_04805, partial [Gammaproteobacteria bacterium]|nr:hypothetical protein [Gammaproteobacteria bacterium]